MFKAPLYIKCNNDYMHITYLQLKYSLHILLNLELTFRILYLTIECNEFYLRILVKLCMFGYVLVATAFHCEPTRTFIEGPIRVWLILSMEAIP